jgi:hypothetical protein
LFSNREAAPRGHPGAPARRASRGRCGGPDVGLDVDRQLGYLLGGTAALVMALTRSRAGKLDDDVLTGHPGVGTSVWKNAARASIP